jgi:hypothetical protein
MKKTKSKKSTGNWVIEPEVFETVMIQNESDCYFMPADWDELTPGDIFGVMNEDSLVNLYCAESKAEWPKENDRWWPPKVEVSEVAEEFFRNRVECLFDVELRAKR